jgi:hypothetical protein
MPSAHVSRKMKLFSLGAQLLSLSHAMPTAVPREVMSSLDGRSNLLPREGFNGMGLVTLSLAVQEYLEDSNAYVRQLFAAVNRMYPIDMAISGSRRPQQMCLVHGNHRRR